MSRHFYRTYLAIAIALLSMLLGGVQLAAWSGSPSPNVLRVAAATIPAPSSASGYLGTTQVGSTYTAQSICPSGGSCYYTCYLGGYYLSNGECIMYTTVPAVQFSWTTTTTTDASGSPLVPEVQVLEASSCTSTSWTTVATVADSTGSYTVNSPSSSDYYAIRTLAGSDWTGPITSCAQG